MHNKERFVRTEQLLGEAAMERLKNARVAIFGLGAVGSYALEALARAGIGEFVLVDFDVVRESNFNRQLLAVNDNIGKHKVLLARERVLSINPNARVFAFDDFAAPETFNKFFDHKPVFTIDAIDSLGPKAQLIAYCLKHGYRFFSSMGAGMRTDLFSVRVGELAHIKTCPLAKMLRKKLKKDGVTGVVPCVYSQQPPIKSKIPLKREEDFYKRGRARAPVGSISYMTGFFGLVLAQETIKDILR